MHCYVTCIYFFGGKGDDRARESPFPKKSGKLSTIYVVGYPKIHGVPDIGYRVPPSIRKA